MKDAREGHSSRGFSLALGGAVFSLVVLFGGALGVGMLAREQSRAASESLRIWVQSSANFLLGEQGADVQGHLWPVPRQFEAYKLRVAESQELRLADLARAETLLQSTRNALAPRNALARPSATRPLVVVMKSFLSQRDILPVHAVNRVTVSDSDNSGARTVEVRLTVATTVRMGELEILVDRLRPSDACLDVGLSRMADQVTLTALIAPRGNP